MRKSVFLLIALAVLMVFVSACTSDNKNVARKSDDAIPQVSEDTSFEDIKAKGKIVIGLDDSFPPLGFRSEENEIVGFDIDMAKEVGKLWGIEVEFKPIVWDNKVLELNSKSIDLIWNGFTVTPEREEQVLFTKPYLENKQIIVVKSDSDIKAKADLAGKVVGLQGGSSAEDALKKDEATYESIGEGNINRYEDNLIAMMDLEVGRVDAVVMDEVVCRYQIRKNPDKYRILDDHFAEEVYAVGGRLQDKALIAELDIALQQLKDNGTSAEVSKKWFEADIVK